MQHNCPSCQFPIAETYYFCPNCGIKLKEPLVSTTIAKQIGIYLLSVLLPPLGLWPGIKYLSQNTKKAKTIGAIAIVLTIIATIITIWITISIINQVNSTVNSQLQQYQHYGF